MAGTESP